VKSDSKQIVGITRSLNLPLTRNKELNYGITTASTRIGNSAVQLEINHLALEANTKRTEAYHVEQQAIYITNEYVINASPSAYSAHTAEKLR